MKLVDKPLTDMQKKFAEAVEISQLILKVEK